MGITSNIQTQIDTKAKASSSLLRYQGANISGGPYWVELGSLSPSSGGVHSSSEIKSGEGQRIDPGVDKHFYYSYVLHVWQRLIRHSSR